MIRYKTLIFNGPILPSSYKCNGFTLNNNELSSLAEQMIWNWAIRIDTEYTKNDYAWKNFLNGLLPELHKDQQAIVLEKRQEWTNLIKSMTSLNSIIKEHKKNISKEEKDLIKKEKDAQKEKYGFAIIDGKKVPIANYMIESAGPLITRGNDPRIFSWKYQAQEKDITINIAGNGKEFDKIRQSFKDLGFNVVNNNKVLWVFKYEINTSYKSIKLAKKVNIASSSDLAQKQEIKKYEKALTFLKSWDKMQDHIYNNISQNDKVRQESALIAYIIQKTGIRIGNEKDDDYAQTVGASTLLVKNLKILKDAPVICLSFDGKDSVPYYNEIEVSRIVYDALKKLVENKSNDKLVFENATSSDVNSFIKEVCSDASPKTFRSAIGTATLCEALAKLNVSESLRDDQKKAAFIKANLEVAKTLNHKKGIGKNHNESLSKIDDAVKTAKEKLAQLREKNAEDEKKLNIKIAKAKKACNSKAVASYKERKNALKLKLEKAKDLINRLETNKDIKKATATIALGTSLNSYCAPSVVASWCNYVKLPLEKIYTKAQIEKFSWATDIDKDYWKSYLNYLK